MIALMQRDSFRLITRKEFYISYLTTCVEREISTQWVWVIGGTFVSPVTHIILILFSLDARGLLINLIILKCWKPIVESTIGFQNCVKLTMQKKRILVSKCELLYSLAVECSLNLTPSKLFFRKCAVLFLWKGAK